MTTTATNAPTVEHGTTVFIPLNKLKKHPRNARKTPHSEASIEAKAASIAAKGILQNLVVEPETDAAGEPTGFYLVSIGEGRRQAQMLRVKRKEIKKTEPIRCVIDTANDAAEISLDENLTREDLHPADQFERFRELSEDRGWGAEEIAARFGVTAHVVKQRMRLGAVSPKRHRQVGATTVIGASRRLQLCREVRSVSPHAEGLGSELAMGGSGDQVTAGGERVGDGSVGRKEPLGRTRRSEAFHLLLPQPDRDDRTSCRMVRCSVTAGCHPMFPKTAWVGQ